MEYEWDNNKNLSNQLKHSVDFLDAIKIFLDEERIEVTDERKDYGEKRYRTIGLTEGIVLTVVYTTRKNRYRIISARRASRHERAAYYHQKYT